MCGICGIYNLDGKPVDEGLLRRMNSKLSHRGPDDEGYHVDGPIGLGHRRLSIIDLNTGHQPIHNEDGTKTIVFNGEIYNFAEIRKDLESKGHVFTTRTDTEVILHGYEEWGTDCLDRLRGMFAFAIWDKGRQTLVLARDRLGIKPLYYSADVKRVVFGSELKAILEGGSVSREIDPEALSDFVSLGYVPSPKSIFKDIAKLPPGYFLIRSREGLSVKRYWDVQFREEDGRSELDWCDRIMETLEEAVRLRLISDVPLGAFLSGGIDSSIVVGLMTRLMDSPVVTNSVGFTKREYSELDYAKVTAGLFGTNHHEFMVDPDAVDVAGKLSWHFDEPFADSSSIPTYYVSKMARENVTVALSGDGGDENFAGYRRYYFDRLENRLRCIIPHLVRRHALGAMAYFYPKADWLPQVFRAKTLLTNLSRDSVFGYFNSMSLVIPAMKERLLSHEFREALKGYDSRSVFEEHYANAGTDDPLSRTQYVDFKTYLPDDILTKVDRASMAVALEARVPILDHKFVELVGTIPSSLKLNGGRSKYILKKAAGRILPREILNRKKMGFSIPVGVWLKNELRPLVEETILGKTFGQRGYFDAGLIRAVYDRHLSGLSDFTQPLWVLLSFELWARRFL
jgi:asparagine synthase (glutamine-hydrolysing)